MNKNIKKLFFFMFIFFLTIKNLTNYLLYKKIIKKEKIFFNMDLLILFGTSCIFVLIFTIILIKFNLYLNSIFIIFLYFGVNVLISILSDIFRKKKINIILLIGNIIPFDILYTGIFLFFYFINEKIKRKKIERILAENKQALEKVKPKPSYTIPTDSEYYDRACEEEYKKLEQNY